MKRKTETSDAGYVRIVGEGLSKLMGGVKLCREEELTRAVLLEFSKSQGDIEEAKLCREEELTRPVLLELLKSCGQIKEVKGLVEVTVQTMAGAGFGVMLEEGGGSNSNVRALKAEIEEAEGTSRHRQELFILVEDADEGSEKPLLDDFEIEAACTVALCVRPGWEWDAASDLIKDKVFELSGPNNSIATKISFHENCMVVGQLMGVGTGKHTISMKLDKDSGEGWGIYCGVVKDGASSYKHPYHDEEEGWFIESSRGSLRGIGTQYSCSSGEIKSGQVLTMQLDTNAGALRFWVDGKHRPGYTRGVTGSLRWATTIFYKGNAVEIVPTPELL